MPIIPLAITITKLAICLTPLFFGIRSLLVTDPISDSFVYDVRRIWHIKGMSRRKFWRRTGIISSVTGLLMTFLFFVL